MKTVLVMFSDMSLNYTCHFSVINHRITHGVAKDFKQNNVGMLTLILDPQNNTQNCCHSVPKLYS